MEQRIGPNIQPLQGAAADPAFVPGITGPRPVAPKDAEPEEAKAADTKAADTESDEAASGETASEDEREEPGDEPSGEEPAEPEEAEEPDEAPEGSPVFEASDRRAKIVADHRGVRLRLDDQEAEFRWDEIGAVETESPRFGKRFTITVHTPDRRWYPIEIEAKARTSFKDWEAQLDEVLDTYFDDGEDEAPAEDSAP
ncbi:hypothetical protein [Streptomyces sp. NPDC050704]|uniref:hypothetical protein n=1 Tax=Streptomyces sp. NPDC050704 TaxID=3157219 RepID=UPI0034326F5D